MTQFVVVKVTTVSALESNPPIASEINRREAIVTAVEWATVRDPVAPWGL